MNQLAMFMSAGRHLVNVLEIVCIMGRGAEYQGYHRLHFKNGMTIDLSPAEFQEFTANIEGRDGQMPTPKAEW